EIFVCAFFGSVAIVVSISVSTKTIAALFFRRCGDCFVLPIKQGSLFSILFPLIFAQDAANFISVRRLNFKRLERQVYKFHVPVINNLFPICIGHPELRRIAAGSNLRRHIGAAIVNYIQNAAAIRHCTLKQEFAEAFFTSGGMMSAQVAVNNDSHGTRSFPNCLIPAYAVAYSLQGAFVPVHTGRTGLKRNYDSAATFVSDTPFGKAFCDAITYLKRFRPFP